MVFFNLTNFFMKPTKTSFLIRKQNSENQVNDLILKLFLSFDLNLDLVMYRKH